MREKTGGVGRVEVLQLRVASASLGTSSDGVGGGGAVLVDDDEEDIPLDEEVVEEPKKKTGSSSSREVGYFKIKHSSPFKYLIQAF